MSGARHKVDVGVGDQGDVDAVVMAGITTRIYMHPYVALSGQHACQLQPDDVVDVMGPKHLEGGM
jgi:hypothetical protein